MTTPTKPVTVQRPNAVLRVVPTGVLDRVPRDYRIALELSLPPAQSTPEAIAGAEALASGALSTVSSGTTATDSPTVRQLVSTRTPARGGAAVTTVTGVETEVLCSGWPAQATISLIRAQLADRGYHIIVRERRACTEPGCGADAPVDPARRDDAPQAWFNDRICDRHNYRACVSCQSVFRLISSNPIGPAPSVHCSVCGAILIEWGGSKLWEAELVSIGPSK